MIIHGENIHGRDKNMSSGVVSQIFHLILAILKILPGQKTPKNGGTHRHFIYIPKHWPILID